MFNPGYRLTLAALAFAAFLAMLGAMVWMGGDSLGAGPLSALLALFQLLQTLSK